MACGLPEACRDQLRSRMAARFALSETSPPAVVQSAMDAIIRLLSGERVDLSFIAIDLDGVGEFERRVYAATRAIPPRKTLTYGELAANIGVPDGAQAVGQALGRNPCPIIVPCHRILAANGRSGGFSAPGGVETKLRMLNIEGAQRGTQASLFERLAWVGKPKVSPPPSDLPNQAR
jgi:methylated-DNA-[protein]-cysteine S-methyltransferase